MVLQRRERRNGPITDIGSRLFDHLVGEHEQAMRNSEAKRLSSLEIAIHVISSAATSLFTPKADIRSRRNI
jgi:hypothetical protein